MVCHRYFLDSFPKQSTPYSLSRSFLTEVFPQLTVLDRLEFTYRWSHAKREALIGSHLITQTKWLECASSLIVMCMTMLAGLQSRSNYDALSFKVTLVSH